MKKQFTYFFLPLFVVLFTNCGPTLKLQPVEILSEVLPKQIEKKDGIYILNGTKYQFSGEISDLQYAPQWQLLGVNYETQRRKSAYTIYDMQQGQTNWTNQGNYALSLLQKDVAMVSNENKQVLLNTKSGIPIRWVDGEDFVVIDDSIALKLSREFSRVDLKTGATKWIILGEKGYTGWMSDELDGNWMYLVGGDLHGFDITSGRGWHQKVNTEYDASRGGRAIGNALVLGLNILSIAAGGAGTEVPYIEPMRAHNVHTRPIISEDQLYFADRKSVMNLNKYTGKTNWEQELPVELGVSDLKVISNNHLLLLGKGYRYVNYTLDKDKAAKIYLLDRNNGQIIKFHQFPKGEIILDHAINDQYIYVCTSAKIYQFDLKLGMPLTIELPKTYGDPVRVLTWSTSAYDDFEGTDDPAYPLVIRTMQGVVALHPVTLVELWYQRLGAMVLEMPPVLRKDRWQLPILLKEHEMHRSWVDERAEVFWFGKAAKIIGLDLLQGGEIVSEFDLTNDNFWFLGNGELVEYGGREVGILRLGHQE